MIIKPKTPPLPDLHLKSPDMQIRWQLFTRHLTEVMRAARMDGADLAMQLDTLSTDEAYDRWVAHLHEGLKRRPPQTIR